MPFYSVEVVGQLQLLTFLLPFFEPSTLVRQIFQHQVGLLVEIFQHLVVAGLPLTIPRSRTQRLGFLFGPKSAPLLETDLNALKETKIQDKETKI